MSGPLHLQRYGAVRFPAAALSSLRALEDVAAGLPRGQAGIRLHGIATLPGLLGPGSPIGAIVAELLGREARPVRAILFDKSATANWSLAWHQDRTIAVRQRVETPGFGPWSIKQRLVHVEPPFALIERMVTLRIHLDDVPADNGPLVVAPGSHRLGRIAESRIDSVVRACGIATCLAERGDIWAYATPILHASAASSHGRRRVFQIDWSADMLPPPLDWLGL